jgi:Uma2 family endonuclease
MYFPSTTQPLVVNEDFGVWAPIDHQRVIAMLTVGLGVLYYREKSIRLEPLPETMLDEAKVSQVPDLLLRDNETDETPVIIEVCKTTGLKADLQKVIQLIDDDLYGIQEGFVYNYKTQQWLRYRKGDGGQATESSFSDVLALDLGQFVV